MADKELPWAGPPKSHLRWPAMLFGIFGVSVGALIVAIGGFAIYDYASSNAAVEIEPPENTVHPDTFFQASETKPSDTIYPEKLNITFQEAPMPPSYQPELPSTSPPSSTASAIDEAHAHAKSKQRTFVARGNEVLRLLDECDQENKLWEEQVLPLLENESGSRIASEESLVRQFRIVMRQDRPSPLLAAEFRTSVMDLVAPIKAALNDEQDSRIPRQELSDELTDLYQQIKELRDSLREPREQIDAIVAAAKSLPATDTSLRQAIADVQNADNLAKTRKIDAEVAEAQRKAADKEAAAAAQLIADKAQAEIDKKQKEAEHARLVAKAKSPEVKRYLSTFLAKSFFQPTGNYMSVRYERTTEELPVSYTRIVSSGALDKSVNGLRTLVLLGSEGFFPGNNWHGRPPWQFDIQHFAWSKSDQEFIQKAQDLLRELGPTLVELEMLAP